MQLYQENITDSLGNALARSSYSVYTDSGRTVLASIFDTDGAATSNPVTSDALGYISFRAADGKYYITVSGSGITSQNREIILFDPSASTGAAGIGYTASGTGAVLTNVQAKLRQTVSVFDFLTAVQIAEVQARIGSSDLTTAVQAALDSLSATGGALYFPRGRYRCTGNLTVHVGTDITDVSSVDIYGDGWNQSELYLDGSLVTKGLYFSGVSDYRYVGTLRNMRAQGANGAVIGVSWEHCNHPRMERCIVRGFTNQGVNFDNCLMSVFEQVLVANCGTGGTTGQVEVDNSTTFQWRHSRISGGGTGGGLKIDRTPGVQIIGGAIESTATPILIGSKTESTIGCVGGMIQGIDLENPGEDNMYIDFGSGLSGSARVQSWDIRGNSGSPSGTTSVPYAVRMNQCSGLTFEANNWAQVGTPTATHELTSTTNLGIAVRAHRHLYGNTFPWVRKNGAQVNAAGPYLDWNSDRMGMGLSGTNNAMIGATPSVLILASQGGHYGNLYTNNSGATTVTALTGGERGMEITIFANDVNTTLTHSAVTADQFLLLAGQNVLLSNKKAYRFVHNGTLWVQTGGPADGSQLLAGDGTSSLPGHSWYSDSTFGFYRTGNGTIYLARGATGSVALNVGLPATNTTTKISGVSNAGVTFGSGAKLQWTQGNEQNAIDLILQRDAANTLAQVNGNSDQISRSYGANGGYWERGSASELLTLSTSGATTDTTANLLPADAIIEAVVARVTTTITTATDWKLGDATIAGRFAGANATMTAGATSVGTVHADQTGTSGPRQTAAAKVRVTTTGTPGAGVIRITVFYRKFIAPTS